MTTDRTTKTLLVLIAIALWGILLRPLLTPTPAQAQSRRVQYDIVVVALTMLLGCAGSLRGRAVGGISAPFGRALEGLRRGRPYPGPGTLNNIERTTTDIVVSGRGAVDDLVKVLNKDAA